MFQAIEANEGLKLFTQQFISTCPCDTLLSLTMWQLYCEFGKLLEEKFNKNDEKIPRVIVIESMLETLQKLTKQCEYAIEFMKNKQDANNE